MNEENFLVKFIPVKHCFLQFSSKWFNKINHPKNACVKVTHPVTKQHIYFSWAPQPAHTVLNDCSVGINATFAQALNLQEGELVVVTSEETVSSLHQIYLTPVTADDYEILELSRDSVEVSFLNQIRIIYIDQILVVWVSKTIHLKLKVDRLEPNVSHGRLEDLSELVIQNVSKAAESRNELTRNINTTSVSNLSSTAHTMNSVEPEPFYWNFLPTSLLEVLKGEEQNNKQETNTNHPDSSEIVCRVHPIPIACESSTCCNSAHDEQTHPFNVFVSKMTLKKIAASSNNSFVSDLISENQSVVVCRLNVAQKPKSRTAKSTKETISDNEKLVSVCIRLCRIEESCGVLNKNINISCVFVSKFLRRVLKLNIGSRVRIQAYKPPLNKTLAKVTLVPVKQLDVGESQTLVTQFHKRVSCRSGVLVNDCCPLPVPMPDDPDFAVLVVLLPDGLDCFPLTHSQLQVISTTVSTEAERSLTSLRGYNQKQKKIHITSSVFKDLVSQGVAAVEFGLQLMEKNSQSGLANILITGKSGSGKSRLAEAIHSSVCGEPYHVFVSVLDCKPLKGKKPESIAKIVAEQVEECLYHEPAVLVMEDLHIIASAPTNNSEPSQENTYFLRLTTVLKELLWQLSVTGVVVIATAETRSQIHPQLLAARGRHCFTTFLHIPPLSKSDRLDIVSELLSARLNCQTLPELDSAAVRTEGCVARDLHRLVDKIIFRACQRQVQTVEVTAEDVSVSLQDFVPSELANVSVSRQSSINFSNLGGLREAKRQLSEVLIWPNKYPEVFSQCPLRLERGVLLYGAPGTGKTLLASAVVGESGLNFITVKGPELLSKYIGASEEAVRNVFEKAQSARPCILFFDEFDSLAPRRGHDSTGVTDRVVNQLLTQMDGVETLEGVWVVAAASRPDLLDPALLRPGRIGNLIHCPTPDQVEREEILQTLGAQLRLSADVDLAKVAAQTEHYTGADLQAVLYSAQMIAYDTLHQDSDDENPSTAPLVNDVEVTQSNLLAALQDTNPSLKLVDRMRFQQIYQNFQKQKGSPNQEPTESMPNLRVTLA
ncbi:peroxisomal ATPase PEX1 [Macrosteles quadrilineatus]|uniref:peroxisomal ATPase PEX1 n=1 Tax=Macrosteles quadrilineatus TaxID=74068 RepID=UPI0023E33D62|nr:peroxisomal ATPase PEX1 [Macrosteles quadrilineatus]XP_054282117.1 peroxisomal ATPase PEX1 [Macrosteles quadrilineatus]